MCKLERHEKVSVNTRCVKCKMLTASVLAVALTFSNVGISNASPRQSEESPSVSVDNVEAAREVLEQESDISPVVLDKVNDTAKVNENLSINSDLGIVTAIPSEEDNNIQSMRNGQVVEFRLTEFYLGDNDLNLPELVRGSESIIANPTEEGLQLLWRLNSGAGLESLNIDTSIPDKSKWMVNDDGSIALLRENVSGISEIILQSKIPWAFDVNGKSLPTHYEISGNTISQVVDTTGAEFPVIADPDWAWWSSLAMCTAEIVTIFVPGSQIIKTAKASKAMTLLAKSPSLKKTIGALGGLNNAMSKLLGKLRGMKYSPQTERALKKLLDEGKGKLFDILGIGGCYGVYVNW